MAKFVKAAKTDDIPPGQVRSFQIEGEFIAISHIDGNFYAIKDECTHMDYPLSDGDLDGEIITCIYHGAQFNVKTGEVVALPAYEPVETYKVKVEENDIYVFLEDY